MNTISELFSQHKAVIQRSTSLEDVLQYCATLTGKAVSVFDASGKRIGVGTVRTLAVQEEEKPPWDRRVILRFQEQHELEICPPVMIIEGTAEEEEEEDETDWFGA